MKKLLIPIMVSIMVFIFVGYVWAGTPNPADVYCGNLGYEVKTITENDGGQHSVCIFPDGSTCDAWRFLEGKCGKEFSLCARNGHDLKVKTDGKNPFSKDYAVCVDKKGKEVGSVTNIMGIRGKPDLEIENKPKPLEESSSEKSFLAASVPVPPTPPLPTSWDWRNYLGSDWTTPVKNQSRCGACWAFSAIGTTEAAYNIHKDNPHLDLNLSEEYLNANCYTPALDIGAGCCGGYHNRALNAIMTEGNPDEACMPFVVPSAGGYGTGICGCGSSGCNATCPHGGGTDTFCSRLFCTDACPDYLGRLVSIKSFNPAGANDQNLMKQNLIQHGPLAIRVRVSYGEHPQGIFRCTHCWDYNQDGLCTLNPSCTNGFCGPVNASERCQNDADCKEDRNNDGICDQDDCGTDHAMIIVGYDDAGGYWIVKNSWGLTDDFNGWWLIGYGECHVEAEPYWVEANDMNFPIISVPGNLTFVDTCLNDTRVETLDICNTGDADLKIYSIATDDSQFNVTTPLMDCEDFDGNGVIAIPEECTGGYPIIISPDFCYPFQVTFKPTSTGQQTATLTISSNDIGRSAFKVEAVGNGTEPNIATAIVDNGNFGDVCPGTYKDLDLTINNSGGCDLRVTGIFSTSAEFLVPNSGSFFFPLSVHAGDSVHLPIRLQPIIEGSKSATIVVDSNDPDTPSKHIGVFGNAPPGDIRVTGSTDFGDVCAETQAEKTISICNVGKCDLDVYSVALNPECKDFTLINNPFRAKVSPDSCNDVVIRFTPTSAGPKSCTLEIRSADPDSELIQMQVTATTPEPSIDVPADQGFPPEVIQSVGLCESKKPFPISNKGKCNLYITNIAVTGDPGADPGVDTIADYSLSGLPSYPIILQPGHVTGGGDFMTVFAPTDLHRDLMGTLTVTYESDPITHATATQTGTLCGEGVRTGARVLVTAVGTPLQMVEKIQLQRINANRNKKILDTQDVVQNASLQTVVPTPPCTPFQFHREYGTVSNPIQLLPGSYQVTATAIVGGKRKSKTVGFDVGTCDFNPNIVINF